MIEQLTTFGYLIPHAEEKLQELLVAGGNRRTFILDIRMNARSRKPGWNASELRAKYGNRYWPLSTLGNVNYNKSGHPIRISHPEFGIPTVIEALQKGVSLILLCACNDYETCHRKVVYEMVKEALEKEKRGVLGHP